jgi:hypothetical protein
VPRRRLVLDADINHTIAGELRNRGRNATSVITLRLGKLKDPDLLRTLSQRFAGEDWILITGDDQLPLEHGTIVAELGITIAVVDSRKVLWEGKYGTLDVWRRDVIHRFAHTMEDQPVMTKRRYGRTNTKWTPRPGKYQYWTKRKKAETSGQGRRAVSDHAERPRDLDSLF